MYDRIASAASLLAWGCAALAMQSCGAGSPAKTDRPPAQSRIESIAHAGAERTYRIHVPLPVDHRESLPLLIVLHGGGGTGRGMDTYLTRGGFNGLSDTERFIVVYPDGIGRSWNDGRGVEVHYAHKANVDDVGFISALIDHLRGQYPIDGDRVYATGISNGGMMSFRLACELADKIAAIAVVAASMSDRLSSRCAPSRPVPVLIINGTEDPLVPWDGGEIRFMNRTFGTVLSTPQTVGFWRDANGCLGRATTGHRDANRADGTSVRLETWGSCEGGVQVVLCTIVGGGHTWPGGYQYLPEHMIGRTSQEIDANRVIWDFLKGHTLRRGSGTDGQ